MLTVEGVGEEFGKRFRSLKGGHSTERFGGGRGEVRSGCALQSSRDEALVSPGGEPGVRQDSLAQHTSKLKIYFREEETWQVL